MEYRPIRKLYHTFLLAVSEIITFKMCDLENFGNGHELPHLQWSQLTANINLCKSRSWAFFASSHSFQDIHISNFVTLKCRSKYNIGVGAIQCIIADFLSDGNSNVCSISHCYEIFTNLIKCQNFERENEVQGQGEKNWTCAIRLEMVDSIRVTFSEF